MKYALILLALVSNMAMAGYKGNDIKEMGKTVDRYGNLVRLFDVNPDVEFFNRNPVCMDRLHATYTTGTGRTESACWWAFGERMFFWAETQGLKEMNTDLVLKNDRYIPLLKRVGENF